MLYGSFQKSKLKSRTSKRKSRRLIGSRTYRNYTDDMLKLACEFVESGQISSRDAERQFGIPRRTIINKIKNKHSKSVGHPTALTAAEELKIVKVLQASSDFGSPLTKIDLQLLVHKYLKKNSRDQKFKNRIPGAAWVQGFLARHADELSLRTTQNISKARAEKGPQEIANYFENLSTTLKDIPPENIANFDETNLSDDPGSSKCIFRRGVKYPERITNSTKGNISLMFTAIASGKCLPLYVVYKATNLYSEWVSGGPPDTRYNCTKSGWFDSAMFENYFETIIIPWAQDIAGTKVVICDNLTSHLSIKVVELCQQNDIKFVFIPPRSTHLTQPLDVAFFGPLKKAWRKILYQYKLRNPNQTSLNKKHFPKLLSELIETIQMKETKNTKSGFRATGVVPFNPQEVLKKLPEIQEEILSYGIDQVLVDYLKETRAPKPMLLKRNKRINCAAGRSVTVSDLNVDVNKNKVTKKSSRVVKEPRKPKESKLLLDEATGIFVDETDLINKHIDENQGSFFDLEESSAMSQCQDIYFPESLNNICITIINSCMGQLVRTEKSLSTFADLSYINTSTMRSVPSSSVKKNKITILSDVIIKAGTSNVCVLKETSNKIENMPFAATSNIDLPDCLQVKKTNHMKKIKTVHSKKVKNVNTKDKVTKDLKGKKSTRGRTLAKKRQKTSDSESSSIYADNEVITVESDDSDYATVHDYYIAECLREQEEEKENFDPLDISFGLHEIEYLTENHEKLEKDDWIIAQFATKKTLKHFVGNVLAINDKIPTVKFVRKVKESKCEDGTTFTYPLVDDICTMQHLQDILTILPKPKIIRRGRIVFKVDFSNFNIQ